MLKDSKQSIAMHYTTRQWGQARKGERKLSVNGNALDHGTQRSGQALNGEKQRAGNGIALDRFDTENIIINLM